MRVWGSHLDWASLRGLLYRALDGAEIADSRSVVGVVRNFGRKLALKVAPLESCSRFTRNRFQGFVCLGLWAGALTDFASEEIRLGIFTIASPESGSEDPYFRTDAVRASEDFLIPREGLMSDQEVESPNECILKRAEIQD